MKKNLLLIAAVFCFAVYVFADGKQDVSVSGDYTTTRGLENLMTSGEKYLLIDVRTPGEYNSGYIPGALNIPYELLPDALPAADKDEPIVLYCRSGNRAGIALKALESAGYTRVINFGGISNWTGKIVRP